MRGLFIQKHAEAVSAFCSIAVLYVGTDPYLKNKLYDFDFSVESKVPTLRLYFRKSNMFLFGKLINAFRYWKSYVKGYNFLKNKSGKPDIVHVHVLTRFGIFALYLKLFKSIPYIITEHWSRYLPYNLKRGAYKGFFRRWITRVVVHHAKAVTTVTENLRDAMLRLGLKNKYFITPNVVDIHKFYPLENISSLRHGRHIPPLGVRGLKKIVHVSCFDEKAKNIKGIVHVIERLSKKRNDFILEIIGDGADFNEVKSYAEKTGLVGKTIFFEGLQTGERLINKMREADFSLLFSNYENFPCIIPESLALGVPVLATDVGGISEHIKKDFGMLVEPGDESGLEKAIDKMLETCSDYNPHLLREYAVNNFSNDNAGKLFYEIYLKSVL